MFSLLDVLYFINHASSTRYLFCYHSKKVLMHSVNTLNMIINIIIIIIIIIASAITCCFCELLTIFSSCSSVVVFVIITLNGQTNCHSVLVEKFHNQYITPFFSK